MTPWTLGNGTQGPHGIEAAGRPPKRSRRATGGRTVAHNLAKLIEGGYLEAQGIHTAVQFWSRGRSGADIHRHEYRMAYFPGDDLFAVNRPRGLPIGNLTSQFWANVYLDGFDHFPQNHQHTITRGLIDAALDFQELLIDANETRGGRRSAYLADADRHLGRIRVYIGLALKLKWISPKQYEHAGRQLTGVGRLLGGWIKVTKQTVTPRV